MSSSLDILKSKIYETQLKQQIFEDENLKQKFTNELRQSIIFDPILNQKFTDELRTAIFSDTKIINQLYQELHQKMASPFDNQTDFIFLPPDMTPSSSSFVEEGEYDQFDANVNNLLSESKKDKSKKDKRKKVSEEYDNSDTKRNNKKRDRLEKEDNDDHDTTNKKIKEEYNKNKEQDTSSRIYAFCGEPTCKCSYRPISAKDTARKDTSMISWTKLYLTNLPNNIDYHRLRTELGLCCLNEINTFPKHTYVNNHYAIIEFTNHDDATTMCNYLNGLILHGIKLQANFCKD
ncbi:MAG: hypothetical protein Barrevirus10_11 [Barrevirus sp.]|uniref:RRM domain-containing protein n=1 Tax=Barrevirus sp. TaxID=2487763 RepID=A0A3G4ZQA6_9VIRU|nr:MAG: hypothetical protein Barrevirus10_11 [Barrevirus sp.]